MDINSPPVIKQLFYHPIPLRQGVLVPISQLEPQVMRQTEEDIAEAVIQFFEGYLYERRLMDRPFSATATFKAPSFLDWILRRKLTAKLSVVCHLSEILKDAPSLATGPSGEPIGVAILEGFPSASAVTKDIFGREKKVKDE